MRHLILIAVFSVSLAAQSAPNCTGVGLDVDARCACIKNPSGKLCEMVRAGFYDPKPFKVTPLDLGLGRPVTQPRTTAPRPAAGPRHARVVPMAHKDYLRFLHPNAQLVAGGAIGKLFQSSEFSSALFGAPENKDAENKVIAALQEMDHLWLSVAKKNEVVLLMTGKFERGATADMFYTQGIRPVFLGGAGAMLIGSEPSIQAALERINKPVAAQVGWATRRALTMSRDHETWIVSERSGTSSGTAAFQAVRQFALGFRLTGEMGVDGEVVADSEAGATGIATWAEQIKAEMRQKASVGALDSLNIECTGATVRFWATGDTLLEGEAGKTALRSDFGVELYALIMGSFPGMSVRTVAEDKLLAVKAGMKRDEVLSLLGPPLSVSSIQGLETPRETWTYQIPFGKQYTARLEAGVVSKPFAQTK